MFDVFTVLGQQMERTLVWLDEDDEATEITCCGENGGQEVKKCGGPNAPSCKTICGAGTLATYMAFSYLIFVILLTLALVSSLKFDTKKA